MAEKKRVPTEKSPVGAAVLSTICPGVGFFYIGNAIKAVAYGAIFVALLLLLIHSRGTEPVAFSFILAGFYIFQIFDAYNEAKRTSFREEPVTNGEARISLFWSVTILVAGIILQFIELGVFRYRDITRLVTRLWPVIFIVLGAKLIYTYTRGAKEGETGGEK